MNHTTDIPLRQISPPPTADVILTSPSHPNIPQSRPETASSQPNHPSSKTISTPLINHDHESHGEGAMTPQEKKELWKHRILLIGGLFFPFFLNAIDTTIISTALPFIASEFSQLSQQSWIVTSFTITGTAFIPAFGQLCDVFGRHGILQFTLVLVWIGSTLCAAAQNFGMLLVGRAIVGVSYSGLLVVTTVALGDKVSLKENALQNTLFSLVSGISFGIGPIIGGHLTSVDWRWCFVLPIPIAILSHVLVYFCLRPILVKAQRVQEISRTTSGHTIIHTRSLTFAQKLSSVDWEGMITFMASCVCIILALSWGGTTYAWDSPQIIILFVIGGVFLGLFFAIEKGLERGGWFKVWGRRWGVWQSRNAMIPLKLFNSKDVCILSAVNLATGISLYSMFYFIATYFIIVQGYSASKSGSQLLYFLPGLGAGAYAAMYLSNRVPSRTFPPIFLGVVLLPIGHGILTTALEAQKRGTIIAMMVLLGFGNGILMMPVPLHAIARKPKQLAQVSATLQFFKPMGGTVALAMMGSVLNNKVGGSGVGGLLGNNAGGHGEGNDQISELLDALPDDVRDNVTNAVREGVKWAFLSVVPIMAVVGFLGFGLGDVRIDFRPLKERAREQEEDEAAGIGGWAGVWKRERPGLMSGTGLLSP